MTNIKKDREITKNLTNIDSYESAEEIINAYHRLYELGLEDLEDFLFEYSRIGIENEYLKYTFETHLISCDYCIERLTRFKLFFDTIDEYGSGAIATVKAKELVNEAEFYIKENRYKEAIKCFQDARKLNPNDKKISTKLDEVLKRDKAVSPEIFFRIYKDEELFQEIPVITEDFSISLELTDPGLYSLIDCKGKIHLQWKNEYKQSEGPFLTTLHSPLRPKIKKIRIKTKESQEVRELTIRLEQKESGAFLLIEIQNDKL